MPWTWSLLRGRPRRAFRPGAAKPRVPRLGAELDQLEERIVPAADPRAALRAVAADVTGDAIPDLVASLPGGTIRIVNGTDGTTVRTFTPFEAAFAGPVSVAAADLNADGRAEVVAGAGRSGGPRVVVYDGLTGTVLRSDFVFEEAFRGGVSVALGDVTGDGTPDLVAGAGEDGGPRVRVFDGRTFDPARDFFAYQPDFTGGTTVGAADLDGDGRADVVAGAGPGGSSHVRAFSGMTGEVIRNFFAGNDAARAGVVVAAGDIDGNGLGEVVAVADGRARVYAGRTDRPYLDLAAADAGAVAVADLAGDGFGGLLMGTAASVTLFGGPDLTDAGYTWSPGSPAAGFAHPAPAAPAGAFAGEALYVPGPAGASVPVRLDRLRAYTGQDNEVGLFPVDDAAGRVNGLSPGDAGYLDAALAAKLPAFRTAGAAGATVTATAGRHYGLYLLNGSDRFVSFAAANPGGISQFRLLPRNRFAADDAPSAGVGAYHAAVGAITIGDGTSPPPPPPPPPLPIEGNFPADLAGYTRTDLGGSETGKGTATVADGVLTLAEGDSFRVGLATPFTVPATPTAVRVAFDAPAFDTTSSGTIRDAFEVAVLDAADRPLALPIAAGRDASVNASEGLDPQTAPGTTRDALSATIDLSALPAGTPARLVLRLVNNDADTGTTVTVRRVDFLASAGGAPAGVTPAAARLAAEAAPDLDDLDDVTPAVRAEYGATTLTEERSILTTTMSLRNTGTYPVAGRLVLVVSNLSDAAVAVLNPDGRTPDGRPYLDLSADLPDGVLNPGEATAPRALRFTNPNRQRFTYDLTALGGLNRNPVFAGTPPTLIEAGKTYSYTPTATDPDGRPLAYSLVVAPPGMTIDPQTGAITWPTTAADIGTAAVRIRATDSSGGSAEQAFTVEVRATVPNRPPVFTSTPPTNATVARPFEVKTYATGDRPVSLTAADFGTGKVSVVTADPGDQTLGLLRGSNTAATPIGVGEPAPDGRLFRGGRAVDIGLPALETSYDRQEISGFTQADVNGDENLDLVSAVFTSVSSFSTTTYSRFVTVALGRGDGTFAPPVRLDAFAGDGSVEYRPLAGLTVRDFDRDGKLDILALSNSQFLFWRGNGDGTFAPVVFNDAGLSLADLRAGDLDRDGKLDLVVMLPSYTRAGVLLGNGDGTFGPYTEVVNNPSAAYYNGYTVADLDGADGPDLVLTNYGQRRLEVFRNDGTGALVKAADLATYHPSPGSPGSGTEDPFGNWVGDFTGDGKADILYRARNGDGGGGLGLWVGAGDAATFTYQAAATGFAQTPVTGDQPPADLDGDGDLDVVFGHADGYYGVTVARNNGDGTFAARTYQAEADYAAGWRNQTALAGVLVGDYNRDGLVDLVAASSRRGGNDNAPAGVSVILADAPGVFAGPADLLKGGQALEMVLTGDLNNDGNADLLVGDGGGFSTRLGRGDGTFGAAQLALGSYNTPTRGFLTDLDHDGVLDLVYTGGLSGQNTNAGYGAALGNGDGTFRFTFQRASGNFYGATVIVPGDFNRDGYTDFASFAAAIDAPGTGTFIDGFHDVFLYDPAAPGTFTRSFHDVIPAGTGDDIIRRSFTAADLDGDGKLDLVEVFPRVGTTPMQLRVFRGRGDGTFDAATTAPQFASNADSLFPKWLVAGDLNEDGKVDLVVTSAYDRSAVLLGNGDGTFGTPTEYATGTSFAYNQSPALRDLDHDGHLDLVSVNDNYGRNVVEVRRGTGDGTLGPREYYQGGGGLISLAFADFDGDGLTDLAAGTPQYQFGFTTVFAGAKPGVVGVTSGDADGDGRADLIAVNAANGHLKLLLGNGDDTFRRQADVPVGRTPVAVAAADLTADGKLDVVTANRAGKSVSVLAGTGTGAFARTDFAVGRAPSGLALGDFTGDGAADILVADAVENGVFLLPNNGGGAFAAPAAVPVGGVPGAVAVADLTGDGKPDAVVAVPASKRVLVLPGNGNGTFGTALVTTTPGTPAGVAAADLNADGIPDLIVTLSDAHQVAVYFGRGGGRFANPQRLGVGKEPGAVTVRDVNGDGKPDVLVANTGDDTVSVVLNRYDPAAVYRYTPTAFDPDGDPVAFDLADAPGGMLYDPATKQVLWAPTAEQVGDNAVTLTASDGRGGVASQGFRVHVTEPEPTAPPAFASPPVTSVPASQAYSYQPRLAGGAGGVRYALVSGPAGATIDPTTGAVAWDPRGGALRFNRFSGDDAHVSIPDRPTLRPASLTAEGWFRFDRIPVVVGLIHKTRAINAFQSTETFSLRLVNGQLRGTVAGLDAGGNLGDTTLDSGWAPQTDRWHHLALTFDDATGVMALFADGQQVGQLATGRHLSYDDNPIEIGYQYGDPLFGTVARVRLWGAARTAAELRAGMTRPVAADAPGLLADYRFADPEAQTVLDSSANGHSGRRAGGFRQPSPAVGLADAQTQRFTIRADDGAGGVAEQTFTVTVASALTRTVTGTVFEDADGDGARDAGEGGSAGAVVYVDRNRNGRRDAGEPAATTAADGTYALSVAGGAEYLALDHQSGWEQTGPATGGVAVDLDAGPLDGYDFARRVGADGPPRFLTTPPAAATARTAFEYAAFAADPLGGRVRYDLPLAPAGMAVDPDTGRLVWSPTLRQVGTASVIVRATSDRGGVALQAFDLAVSDPNTAPVITSMPPSAAGVGVPLVYAVTAQDAEQTALVYALVSGPAGTTLDAAGRLAWTPAEGQLGPQVLTVRVSDGVGGEVTQTFTVNVTTAGVNRDPAFTGGVRLSARAGLRYVARLTAADPDGDPPAFALASGPAGMTVSADGLVAWTPTADQVGPPAVRVTVSDGRGGSATREFTVGVGATLPNRSPVVASTPPASALVGRPFAYDLRATDPDADPVAYQLLAGPAGLSLDPVRGTVRWTPGADQFGPATVVLRAVDPFGGSADQSFTLAVVGAGGPPAITSTPPTDAAVGQTYLYAVTAADADGDPLVYSLDAAPAGMTIDPVTGDISWTPAAGQLGPQAVIVRVSDGAGGFATQAFAVEVVAGRPNRPPVIDTAPPTDATAGTTLRYTLRATDPDGTTVRHAVVRGPAGLTVDPDTGLVQWTPAAADVGRVVVTLSATDADGAAAVQGFELLVAAANRPPVISGFAPQRVTAGNVYRYDVRATDADLDPLAFTLVNGPAGMTIDAFGRVAWPATVGDIGPHTATVRVSDGRSGTAEQTLGFAVVPDTTPPRVSVIPAAPVVRANSPEIYQKFGLTMYPTNTVRVSAVDDVGVAGLTVTANGKPVALDADGNATFSYKDWGFGGIRIVATAKDAAGNPGAGVGGFAFIPFGDDPAAGSVAQPLAVITSPDAGAAVGGLVTVRGTATSDGFTGYTLSYRRADKADYTTIATGTSKVVDGVLGKWDTSFLENGEYVLRLEETDDVVAGAGFATTFERTVGVSGDVKLGNFTLSFADVTLPAAGLPLTVTRTYDTLRADKAGDFGYGWRLEYRDTDLRTTLGTSGLEDLGIFPAFRPGTKVYLTLPGGQREGFAFTPDIRVLPGLGNSLVVATPRFTADPGVRDVLTVRGGTYIVNEFGELISGGGQPYNPAAEEFGGGYAVTTPDGTSYRIDGQTGDLLTAADRAGNTLTFTDRGITGPGGAALTFERDARERITAVIDPAGNAVRYSYSAAGDLASVTDREGNTTRFVYRTDRPHFLDSVIDPLGRTGVRAEYGPDGRLVGTVDANGNAVRISYDPANSLVTRLDPLGRPTVFEYDARGNVVAETDALGGVTRTAYDAANNPVAVTDPLGRTTRYEYDAAGNVTAETDPLGHTTRTAYGRFGNPVTTTDPLGNTTTFADTAAGDPRSVTDPLGNTTAIGYAAPGVPNEVRLADGTAFAVETAGGRVTRVVAPDGRSLAIGYDAAGEATGVTVAGGQAVTTSLARDREGRVTAVTDPAGGVVRFEYDPAGNVAAVVDPLGRRTEVGYDAAGRPTETRFPDGTRSRTEYDAAGRVTAEVDRGGRATRYEYDAVGRRVAVVYPDATPADPADNPRTRTEYDLAGQVTATVDELGRRTTYEYDPAGRRTAVADPLGAATRTGYDAADRPVAVTDPLDRVTRTEYDAAGRPTATVYPDGWRETTAYGPRGEVAARTDPAGFTTRYEYDADLRLAAVVDPLGNRTAYGYTALGQVAAVTDPLGRVTRLEYDPAGRLTARVLTTGERETFAYDPAGRQTARTDFNGVTTAYGYDLAGRRTSEAAPGLAVSTTYTPTGLPATQTDARGVTRYEYDARDRLVSRTEPDGRAVRYEYDAAGSVVGLTSPAGEVRYEYDPAGRPAAVTDPAGGVTRYEHDRAGGLVRTAYPDGTAEARTLDARGRPAVIETTGPAGLLARLSYTFDGAGRRASLTEADGTRTDWTFDPAGRLTREVVAGPGGGNATDYAYDRAGNRLTRADGRDGTTAYEYDARDRLVRETTGGVVVASTYDANGNRLTRGTGPADRAVYTWDAAGRLVEAAVTTPAGTETVRYVYGPDGVRVARVVDGAEVRLLVDANRPYPEVVAETTAGGVVVAGYVLPPGRVGTVSEARGGVTRHPHADALGSVRFVTAGGAAAGAVRYDAFGRLTGTPATDRLFAGESRDPVTGLDFLRARYYDAATGRFVSADPFPGLLDLPVSLNKYVYAGQDPVNNTDPSGLLTLPEVLVSTFIIATSAAIGAQYGRRFAEKHHLDPRAGLVVGAILGGAAGAAGAWAAIRLLPATRVVLTPGGNYVRDYVTGVIKREAVAVYGTNINVLGRLFAGGLTAGALHLLGYLTAGTIFDVIEGPRPSVVLPPKR